MIQHLEYYIGENIILAGDFNINIETNHNYHYYKSLLQLIKLLELTDIWMLKNPHTVRFTRREKTRYGFKQTRIDFFLISCGFQYYINKVDILLPSIKSDHSLLQISIHLENKQKQGKGFWKLNSSLLQDEKYIAFMKSVIEEAIYDSKYLNDLSLSWDFIKSKLRIETITFSINKKSMNLKIVQIKNY